jgi:uncharacterized protein YkwD
MPQIWKEVNMIARINEMRWLKHRALWGSLMVLIWAAGGSAAEAATPQTMTQAGGLSSAIYTLSAQEQNAVSLINLERKNAGLEFLKVNLNLSKLAANFATDMNNRKFFAHVDPDGKDPFDRMAAIGVDYPNAGENIALSSNVNTAHKMLMDSPLHRENILNPKFTEIGIGVRPDSRGGVYLVQEFIGP